MHRALMAGLAVAGVVAWQGLASAEPVNGTIKSVDTANNNLKLERDTGEEVTLKWNDEQPGLQALENAEIGQQIAVDANPSMGAWEVTAIRSKPSAQDASTPGAPQAGASQTDAAKQRSADQPQEQEPASRQY